VHVALLKPQQLLKTIIIIYKTHYNFVEKKKGKKYFKKITIKLFNKKQKFQIDITNY